jgi:hypothetical protein
VVILLCNGSSFSYWTGKVQLCSSYVQTCCIFGLSMLFSTVCSLFSPCYPNLFTEGFHVLQTKSPTLIEYDSHEYIFEGFSLFSHYKIDKVSCYIFADYFIFLNSYKLRCFACIFWKTLSLFFNILFRYIFMELDTVKKEAAGLKDHLPHVSCQWNLRTAVC